MVAEQRADSLPDPEVWVLLDAVAAPAVGDQLLPGEREALEAFRSEHLAPGRRVGRLRVRRSAGAAAASVGLFLASGTAAAAATGVLPGPAQHLAHVFFERVAISVPDAEGPIERDRTIDHRRAGLPDKALRPVARPPQDDRRPSPSFDDAVARTPPVPVARETVRPGRSDHPLQGTDSPAPPASTSHGSVHAPAAIGTPASQGAAPVTPQGGAAAAPQVSPPRMPPGANGKPPGHANAGPPPTAPMAQPPGKARNQRHDAAPPTTPVSTGEVGPVAPPMPHLDRDPPTEETTQRRSR